MRKDKSMIDVAYEILEAQSGGVAFRDLVDKVAEILEMSEEEKMARLGAFYTDLTLDGDFVALSDNHWDLRKHHTYDKVHIDYNEVYSEEVPEDGEEKDKEEEDDEEKEGEDGEDEDGEGSSEEEEKQVTLDDDVASFVGQN